MYRITIRKQAIKTLRRMRRQSARWIRLALEELARNPARQDCDLAPLKGRSAFRLRVGGWRVILEMRDGRREIHVLRIGPRGDVYKRPGDSIDRTANHH